MGKNDSPCIDVCKYRDDGHCLGCSMTKTQKKISKSLKSKDKQLAFKQLVKMQQAVLGGYEAWEKAHEQKHRSKGRSTIVDQSSENQRTK